MRGARARLDSPLPSRTYSFCLIVHSSILCAMLPNTVYNFNLALMKGVNNCSCTGKTFRKHGRIGGMANDEKSNDRFRWPTRLAVEIVVIVYRLFFFFLSNAVSRLSCDEPVSGSVPTVEFVIRNIPGGTC